jgi:hypothetical protein
LKGNGHFHGAAVCKNVQFNGNAASFVREESVEGIDLNLDSDEFVPLTYLHVTENPINVTSG